MGGQICLTQREITEEDVCPICQESLLLKNQTLTFCRHGCGNSIHLKCMIIWGDHQQSVGEPFINCPLCRENFGPLQTLENPIKTEQLKSLSDRRIQHIGTVCNNCKMSPIVGRCYRCRLCLIYYLCHKCSFSNIHRQHPFYSRTQINHRWVATNRSSLMQLPEGIIHQLMERDITDDDYDLLSQLDINSSGVSQISEHKVYNLPLERLSKTHDLLCCPQQCQICLTGYHEGDYVRTLPCKHKFHRKCIDKWLTQRLPTCPLDGKAIDTPQIEKDQQHLSKKIRPMESEKTLSPVSPFSPSSLNVSGSGIQLVPLSRPAKKNKNLYTISKKTIANNTHAVKTQDSHKTANPSLLWQPLHARQKGIDYVQVKHSDSSSTLVMSPVTAVSELSPLKERNIMNDELRTTILEQSLQNQFSPTSLLFYRPRLTFPQK